MDFIEQRILKTGKEYEGYDCRVFSEGYVSCLLGNIGALGSEGSVVEGFLPSEMCCVCGGGKIIDTTPTMMPVPQPSTSPIVTTNPTFLTSVQLYEKSQPENRYLLYLGLLVIIIVIVVISMIFYWYTRKKLSKQNNDMRVITITIKPVLSR